jgi:hypothetical protein
MPRRLSFGSHHPSPLPPSALPASLEHLCWVGSSDTYKSSKHWYSVKKTKHTFQESMEEKFWACSIGCLYKSARAWLCKQKAWGDEKTTGKLSKLTMLTRGKGREASVLSMRQLVMHLGKQMGDPQILPLGWVCIPYTDSFVPFYSKLVWLQS